MWIYFYNFLYICEDTLPSFEQKQLNFRGEIEAKSVFTKQNEKMLNKLGYLSLFQKAIEWLLYWILISRGQTFFCIFLDVFFFSFMDAFEHSLLFKEFFIHVEILILILDYLIFIAINKKPWFSLQIVYNLSKVFMTVLLFAVIHLLNALSLTNEYPQFSGKAIAINLSVWGPLCVYKFIRWSLW